MFFLSYNFVSIILLVFLGYFENIHACYVLLLKLVKIIPTFMA